MPESPSLKAELDELRTKYRGTLLIDRLDDASSMSAIENASASWIRDSEEVVNAVWLEGGRLFDVTWVPTAEQSMVNILPLSQVLGFELREASGLVSAMLPGMTGNVLARVWAQSTGATLLWAASSPEEIISLRGFVKAVVAAQAAWQRAALA